MRSGPGGSALGEIFLRSATAAGDIERLAALPVGTNRCFQAEGLTRSSRPELLAIGCLPITSERAPKPNHRLEHSNSKLNSIARLHAKQRMHEEEPIRCDLRASEREREHSERMRSSNRVRISASLHVQRLQRRLAHSDFRERRRGRAQKESAQSNLNECGRLTLSSDCLSRRWRRLRWRSKTCLRWPKRQLILPADKSKAKRTSGVISVSPDLKRLLHYVAGSHLACSLARAKFWSVCVRAHSDFELPCEDLCFVSFELPPRQQRVVRQPKDKVCAHLKGQVCF